MTRRATASLAFFLLGLPGLLSAESLPQSHITRSPGTPRRPSPAATTPSIASPDAHPGPPLAAGAMTLDHGPVPSDLAGELFVFDLRRLEIYRANPDGTQLNKIHVDVDDPRKATTGHSKKGGTAAAGAATGASAVALDSALLGTSGFLAPTAGEAALFGATGAAIYVAAPAFGIMKMVQVLKRHGRPVRAISQVQPIAAISPSGDRMLFCSDVEHRVEDGHLRLLDLHGEHGTHAHLVHKFGVSGVSPDISPDGASAVFVAPPEKKTASEIYRISLAEGTCTQLTHDGAMKTFPRWSPDGTQLAFQQLVAPSPDDVSLQIVVMPASGGDAVQITQDEIGAVTPSWSPDGKTIVYGSLSDGAVHSVRLDGSDDVALTEGGTIKLHPQESPDGAYVMYLDSSVLPSGLDPEASAASKSKEKPELGKDFQLHLLRIADHHEWTVPLLHGVGAPGDLVEKTNLYWFQWRRPPSPPPIAAGT